MKNASMLGAIVLLFLLALVLGGCNQDPTNNIKRVSMIFRDRPCFAYSPGGYVRSFDYGFRPYFANYRAPGFRGFNGHRR